MEKETVKAFNLEAAFKALDEIAPPEVKYDGRFIANRVNLHERLSAKPGHDALVEDYFDVNDTASLEQAQEERESEIAKAKLARIEKIVDLDAETEEDILPSYVGKTVIQCPQCMTLFYKNPEDIETSEEAPEVVNINEVCQHCGNTSGYTLVGKIDKISEDEVDKFDVDEDTVIEDELNLDFPEDGTEEVDPDVDSGLEDEVEETTEEVEVEESINRSRFLQDAEKDGDLATTNNSEHLSLHEDTEEIVVSTEDEQPESEEAEAELLAENFDDKELDEKLRAHDLYIEHLRTEIKDYQEKLHNTNNEEIAANIEQQISALNAALEAALPASVKEVVEATPAEDADSIEVEIEESVNTSKVLQSAEKRSALAPDEVSCNLTLNEELDAVPCKLAFIDISGSLEAAKEATTKKALADGYELKDIKYFNDHGYTTVLEAAKDNCQIAVYTNNDYETNCPELKELENVTIYENLEEGIGDWVRKTFDKPASIKTQQSWEDELNGEFGEISDERRKELETKFANQRDWEKRHGIEEAAVGGVSEEETDEVLADLWAQPQPTEVEIEAILNGPRFNANLEAVEDFDEESFDKHLTEYFNAVYDNVGNFKSTKCSVRGKKLIVEGIIHFNSGRSKNTKFVFEQSRHGFIGSNNDLSSDAAFKLSTKVRNNTIFTENLSYKYMINDNKVQGRTVI